MTRRDGERGNAQKLRGRFMRRLADMTVRPVTRRYEPPPKEECDPPTVFFTYPTGDENDQVRIVIRLVTQQSNIVEFSIQQETLVERRWAAVARIDSCHGTVHRHQYDQAGNDLLDHELITEIPPAGAEDVLAKGYTQAYELMHDEWEDNLRRWRGDRA